MSALETRIANLERSQPAKQTSCFASMWQSLRAYEPGAVPYTVEELAILDTQPPIDEAALQRILDRVYGSKAKP